MGRFLLAIIAILSLSACGNADSKYLHKFRIQNELRPVFDRISVQVAARGSQMPSLDNLTIRLGDTSWRGKTLAYCLFEHYRTPTVNGGWKDAVRKEIVISERFTKTPPNDPDYETFSADSMEEALWHELGHCLWMEEHRDEEFDTTYMGFHGKFPKDIMNPYLLSSRGSIYKRYWLEHKDRFIDILLDRNYIPFALELPFDLAHSAGERESLIVIPHTGERFIQKTIR